MKPKTVRFLEFHNVFCGAMEYAAVRGTLYEPEVLEGIVFEHYSNKALKEKIPIIFENCNGDKRLFTLNELGRKDTPKYKKGLRKYFSYFINGGKKGWGTIEGY